MRRGWLAALSIALAHASSSAAPGRPDRVEQRHYASGALESVRFYRGPQKTGLHLTLWPDGRLRTEASFANDAYQGSYRSYYPSGKPYELRHYERGREAGLQQSWTEDGALFLNYEARDGRRYGLVNAKPCTPVDGRMP